MTRRSRTVLSQGRRGRRSAGSVCATGLVVLLMALAYATPTRAALYITPPGVTCPNDPRLATPVAGQDYCLQSTDGALYRFNGSWIGALPGILPPANGGTGINNGTRTITLGGSLTTSGAFATTLTMTAPTSVTLPVTGTLATLAGAETLTNKVNISSALLTAPRWVTGATAAGSRYPAFPLASSQVFIGNAWNPPSWSNAIFGGTVYELIALNHQPTITPPSLPGGATQGNIIFQYLSGKIVTPSSGHYAIYGLFADMPAPAISGSSTVESAQAFYTENVYNVSPTASGPQGEPQQYTIFAGGTVNPSRFDQAMLLNHVFSQQRTSTSAESAFKQSVTWNNAGAIFYAHDILVTNTASAAGSMVERVRTAASGTPLRTLDISGNETIFGNLIVSGAGPHVFGDTVGDPDFGLKVSGVVSGGVYGLGVVSAVAPNAGGDAYGFEVSTELRKAGSGTHANFAGALFRVPSITAGGSTLTNASTVKISGAPSVGTNKYAFWIEAGQVRIDDFKTTGSATGKKIVCVDTSTGILYASSSDVQCLN